MKVSLKQILYFVAFAAMFSFCVSSLLHRLESAKRKPDRDAILNAQDWADWFERIEGNPGDIQTANERVLDLKREYRRKQLGIVED